MKFFLPATRSTAEAERVLHALKDVAVQWTGWRINDRRIYHMEWVHKGKCYAATVGKREQSLHEIVVAILESDITYFVFTRSRGVIRGSPIIVRRSAVQRVVDFR